MAASAMDVISDTEWAITSYEGGHFSDKGLVYLVLYGLLQAMYVQQDGLENLVRALERNELYKIDSEPEAGRIRQVRHDTIGHPTRQGGVKPRRDGRPGEQISHTIVQHSLRKEGFTLARYSNLTGSRFVNYETATLIATNRLLTIRGLKRIKRYLGEMEMQHREQYRGKVIVDLFPAQIGYYFEKVFEAINNPSHGNQNINEIGLRMISEAFSNFKQSLAVRGVLNDVSAIRYELDETEYPLQELTLYFSRQGTLSDKRAHPYLPILQSRK